MGCGGSSAAAAEEPETVSAPAPAEDEVPDLKPSTSESAIKRSQSQGTGKSMASTASITTKEALKVHHERLRKLRDLDGATKIPFILVELVGHGHKDGYIEICGKDEYGVYSALEEWLKGTWRCKTLDPGDLRDDSPLPFCDALYKWEGFLMEQDGTNNMGLSTMRLVDFMCGKLSWTLGVINGGNVGMRGEVREVQIIFKAPHPMNLEAHHIMVELRSAGYVEVSGDDRKAKDALHKLFVEDYGSTPMPGHARFCDRYYSCSDGVFKERGSSGENNLGKVTVDVCDRIVKMLPGWSLCTMNGGNYGESGTHREQQLVFRCDNNPLGAMPHLLLELREVGFIEVTGCSGHHMIGELTNFLQSTWGCSKARAIPGQEPFCDLKFNWKFKDMAEATAELTGFFHEHGWQMQVCSQGTVNVRRGKQVREQQILFRPGASEVGHTEPHLFLELYTGEGKEELYNNPKVTQTLANQKIRIAEVGDCADAKDKLAEFIAEYLGGGRREEAEGLQYYVDIFLTRGLSSNNLGCWTMRLCDFMVDRLGWSFVVCNICNLGPAGQYREQQLVFRFDGERKEVPVVRVDEMRIDEVNFYGLQFPDYWQTAKVKSLMQMVNVVSCTKQEIQSMQGLFDETFKRILTRDRVYEYQLKVAEEMPYRLEVVHAFRSEHAELYRRFAERRSKYGGGPSTVQAKTLQATSHPLLNSRLGEAEALLFHGTNPSSAMGILKTGFVLRNAGKSTGTMFGNGIYLAECVSKSDEYARDDKGGTYPGLMAMLVCRCFVGRPHVVTESGDAVEHAKSNGFDCVLGDRESKVGTYREFVFFDERQVLPEYTVIYKRQYSPDSVPQHMVTDTAGTTGRNWQVQLDKAWKDMSPDVSFALTKALNVGVMTVDREVGSSKLRFDLTQNTQTNLDTGKERKIRPPMRR
mmetsp:Transcript_60413/g.144027  ORF Transcript_60413/g.144027 Transcript_60413/m.144027 type:complete len:921 (-) Transcript_60413:127-2889(-)